MKGNLYKNTVKNNYKMNTLMCLKVIYHALTFTDADVEDNLESDTSRLMKTSFMNDSIHIEQGALDSQNEADKHQRISENGHVSPSGSTNNTCITDYEDKVLYERTCSHCNVMSSSDTSNTLVNGGGGTDSLSTLSDSSAGSRPPCIHCNSSTTIIPSIHNVDTNMTSHSNTASHNGVNVDSNTGHNEENVNELGENFSKKCSIGNVNGDLNESASVNNDIMSSLEKLHIADHLDSNCNADTKTTANDINNDVPLVNGILNSSTVEENDGKTSPKSEKHNIPRQPSNLSNSRKEFKEEAKFRSTMTLGQRYHPSSRECTVMSCLHQFTSAELLTGNNKFGCVNCSKNKHKQTAAKGNNRMIF